MRTVFMCLVLLFTLPLGVAESRVKEKHQCEASLAPQYALESINKSEWGSYAEHEIRSLGNLAVSGGVIRGRVHNQKKGEDCWAQTITMYLESWFEAQTEERIQLSPERVLATFIYEQFHQHLGKIEKLVNDLKSDAPSQRKHTLELLQQAYGPRAVEEATNASLNNKLKFIHNAIFHPDDGNSEWSAIELIRKYGIVPEAAVQGTFRQDSKENGFESALYRLWSNLIDEARQSRSDADLEAFILKYRKLNANGFNETLFNFLKSNLDRYLTKSAFVSPTDTFVYKNQKYTGKTFYDGLFAAKNFEIHRDLVAVQSTKDSQTMSIKAVAVGLVRSGLPIPIGMALIGDKVSSEKDAPTAFDFAEKTGLFTTSVCPNGDCKEEDGEHEVSVVNFIYKSKNGRTLAPDKLEAAIVNDEIEITALITQNSWGESVGLDVNGQIPKRKDGGGYYVFTSEMLEQTAGTHIHTPFDFAIPRDVAEDPVFKGRIGKLQGHWKAD